MATAKAGEAKLQTNEFASQGIANEQVYADKSGFCNGSHYVKCSKV
jgi:hypothetical protein